MEQINHAAQAYVMLGRIQSINQLYLSLFGGHKIKINQEASSEACRLHSVAINAKRSLLIITPENLSLKKHINNFDLILPYSKATSFAYPKCG